jgi:outer membrane protein
VLSTTAFRYLLLTAAAITISAGCNSGDGDEPKDPDTSTTSVDSVVDVMDTTGLSAVDTSESGEPGAAPKDFKIGHIYSAEILLVMPARVAVDKQLENEARQLEQEIANMYTDYEKKYKRLLTDSSLTEARQQALVSELATLETTIQKLQMSGQNDLLARKEELYQPIFDRINSGIKRVAKAQGYTYIIDASQGSLVYGVDSYDITPFVKKELGLK